MTIRLRDSTNQEPDFFVWELTDFTTKICSKFPIGSKELQALLRVSKHLREIVYYIYTKNMQDILKQYANYDTPLNRIISTQSYDDPLNSFETICKIQQFLIQQIRNLGIPYPNKHLGLENIPRVNQAIEDLNLQKIWGPISQVLDVEGQPEENAPAHEIRLWMNQNQNHLQEITWLDLSGSALTTIPREITLLTGLQVLHLFDNEITVLPQGIFAGLNQLQVLSLNNNQITVLPQGIFAGLNQLQWLDLNSNQIGVLPQGAFDGLNQLKKLFLHDNQITVLPQGIFDQLIQLQELRLYNNQIIDLPQGIFDQLIQLQELHLYNNQITDLPQGIFDQLNQLQWLCLHHNQITILPQDIFAGLNQLQYLYLQNNQITILPQDIFAGLHQLQYLYLQNNQITILPQDIFAGLHQLQWLGLEANKITVLSQGVFDRLHQLQQLDLHDNQISALPQGIFDKLNQLQGLYLNGNRLLFCHSTTQTPGVNTLKDFKEFDAYVCRSSFAQFYKFAAQRNSFNDIMGRFDHLSPYLQNLINAVSLDLLHSSMSYEQRFNTTLKRTVWRLFETSPDQLKNVIYAHVLQLTQESDAIKREQNPALPPEDFTDPNWGRDHAWDNILKLIDAMSLCSNGLLG